MAEKTTKDIQQKKKATQRYYVQKFGIVVEATSANEAYEKAKKQVASQEAQQA